MGRPQQPVLSSHTLVTIVSFTLNSNKNLGMDGRNLALLCTTDRLSDLANSQISLVAGGSRDQSDFSAILHARIPSVRLDDGGRICTYSPGARR
jgi:hypothetical protein